VRLVFVLKQGMLFTLLRAIVEPLREEERVSGDAPASAATLDGRTCVSFGGCGMLYPYQLGVVEYLLAAFECSSVRAAGHSAGFAAALCLAVPQVTTDTHARVLAAARERWRSRPLGFCLDSEAAWMAPYVSELGQLEEDVLAAAADGRLCLGHTRLRAARGWRLLAAGHCATVRFASLRDFVHAVTVSQRCPPFYRSPGWRDGAWGLDGALSAAFTLPPRAQPGRTVTVSPTNRAATVRPAQPLPLAWFAQLPSAERWRELRRRGFEDAAAARTPPAGLYRHALLRLFYCADAAAGAALVCLLDALADLL
jgi:hypothetical protein